MPLARLPTDPRRCWWCWPPPERGGQLCRLQGQSRPGASHLAGACLIVDYVLTVAVSIAAGVAALVSAFPILAFDALPIALGILALLTALNLRGKRVLIPEVEPR